MYFSKIWKKIILIALRASIDKIANNEIKEYINANKRGKDGQVIYNLEDFNVDKSEFYKSFKFYFDKFNILKEV